MDWPRITVVTPTFNRIEYLEECIQSVIGQEYPNLEYIICDGGSTNPEVLRLIEQYRPRLAWWDSRPDRGHAEAIRRGFDRATGGVLAYLCSDDTYQPGALRAIGEAFAADPKVDVVYGNVYNTDAAGRIVRETRSVPPSPLGLITRVNMAQPATFWTRRGYERAGGNFGGAKWEYAVFEPQMDLFIRFARARLPCRNLRRFIATLRQHPGTVSARNMAEIARVPQECLRREFPFWSHPLRYRLLWAAMRTRQVYWHLRQGELGYLVRRGRLPGSAAANPAPDENAR